MAQGSSPLTHRIRFCTTCDGVNIAFASGGSGWPLIKTPNWLNHVELDVGSLVWRAWIAQMSHRFQLVRYDGRGCGLSDRDISDASFAANQMDLESVVAATGLKRFALYGASQGAAIAIEFAARHPERVSHLILCGPYLQGPLKRDASTRAIEEVQTLLKIIELGWGRENSMFRQVFANQFIPDSSLEQLRAFDDIQRQTIQPEGAARLMASFNEVDVSELARQVTCPTLVLHSREDARIPFEEGRRVASAIRAAEFVPLDSRNHILLDHQSAWTQCFDEIDAFMRRHGGQAQRNSLGAADLTPTEERVLDVVAAGLNNAQIAAELGISPKTVRNHINHIFSKLGMSDRSRVIILAREAGFGRSQ